MQVLHYSRVGGLRPQLPQALPAAWMFSMPCCISSKNSSTAGAGQGWCETRCPAESPAGLCSERLNHGLRTEHSLLISSQDERLFLVQVVPLASDVPCAIKEAQPQQLVGVSSSCPRDDLDRGAVVEESGCYGRLVVEWNVLPVG